jgi:hypothetical protein
VAIAAVVVLAIVGTAFALTRGSGNNNQAGPKGDVGDTTALSSTPPPTTALTSQSQSGVPTDATGPTDGGVPTDSGVGPGDAGTGVSASNSGTNPPDTFNTIDLTALCSGPGSGSIDGSCSRDRGTTIIGGHAFAYESAYDIGDSSNTALAFPTTTCESISLTFGLADQNRPAGESVTISVLLGSGSPQKATATTGLITLNATLTPGSAFAVTTMLSGPDTDEAYYVAGSAMCSSDNGG